MQCPRCNTILDDDTAFCGNCGTQIAPLHAQGETMAVSIDDEETLEMRSNPVGNRQPPPVIQRFSPPAAPYVPASDTPLNVILHQFPGAAVLRSPARAAGSSLPWR